MQRWVSSVSVIRVVVEDYPFVRQRHNEENLVCNWLYPPYAPDMSFPDCFRLLPFMICFECSKFLAKVIRFVMTCNYSQSNNYFIVFGIANTDDQGGIAYVLASGPLL